jgi:hypothetical protein
VETLQVCLQLLEEETQPAQCTAALQTLIKIFRNITANPSVEKFRRIRKENAAFKAKVWQFAGTQQFLLAAGWIEIDDAIVLAEADDDKLKQAIKLLEELLSKNSPPTASTSQNESAVKSKEEIEKEQKLQDLKAKQLTHIRRDKEERQRISDQIKADRENKKSQETRPSKARDMNRDAKMTRFDDIGIDLNGGGGG